MKHGLWKEVALLIALMVVLVMAPARAQSDAADPIPADIFKAGDKGVVILAVQFAADGSVKDCRVVRSNVPYPLEAAVIDYARRKWMNDFLAGETIYFPITFDEVPWYATGWNQGLVPPPDLLSMGDPPRKLKLRITFGADGWVRATKIIESSGVDLVDHETAIWVRVHWHDDAYAGQTVDTPFEFRPPQPAPVVTPSAKPATPPPVPAEPPAPPAVRVE
jgi:hypothetical protein